MTMIQFDSAAARRVEEIYATPDVVEQRRAVLSALVLRSGERVLDVGSGPGMLAVEMAAKVGPGGQVCGIDISDSMLTIADARAHALGGVAIEFRRGDATAIPYADGSFDVAVSTQVLEYVADIPGALGELRRVLRPGGRLVLLDTDWDSIVWHSSDDERMQRVLVAFEQHLVDPHLPRTLWPSLDRAGFQAACPLVVSLLNVGYRPATYSAGLLELIAEFVVGRDGVSAEETEAWASDLRALGADYFFSLNRYLFCATSRV